MIGDLLLQAVIQEPKVIEPLANHFHQFPFALDVIKEEQEHHLQDHLGRDRLVPVLPVAVRHFLAHKTKIDRRSDSAQWMSGSHPLLQVHRVIKELRIALVLSHHDGNTLLPHLPQLGYFFLSSQADLGNTPKTSNQSMKPTAPYLYDI